MKKISLKNLNLNEVESLSREQLKNVFGGSGEAPTTSGGCQGDTRCKSGCSAYGVCNTCCYA